MDRTLDRSRMEVTLAALVGSCDVDGGPTDEQWALMGALASGYFHTSIDPRSLDPLSPEQAAGRLDDEARRHRMFHLMVFAEMCRHPLTEAQVERTDSYARAFGITDDGQTMARDLVARGNAAAEADFMRSFAARRSELEEPAMAHRSGADDTGIGQDEIDPEVFERIASLGDCPAGSLGRAFAEFYETNGFELPHPDDPYAGVFAAHDMTHVIAAYGPSGLEEVALGAMQIGMADTEVHWIQFLGNLGVHEARFVHHTDAPPVLAAPGAMDVVAHAFERGTLTARDFSVVDHLSMADLQLEEVRARFGVAPRER
ncbi:MAG: hypothetical protein ACKO5A_02970 [Actinomycetota bacterium]